MPKVLCISGMAIAGVIFILFVLDLFTAMPFGKAGGMLMDIFFLLCAAGLAFLSWSAFREQD